MKPSCQSEWQIILNTKKCLEKFGYKALWFSRREPYIYDMIQSTANRLHSLNRIRVTAKMKISGNILLLSKTHVNGFKEQFPNVNLVPYSDILIFNRSLIIDMRCFLSDYFLFNL